MGERKWFWMPGRRDIERLKVGDLAPNCFGDWRRVVEIFAKDENVHGEMFVCYYTELGPTSRISGSMTEGELVRHVGLGDAATVWRVEREMRASLGKGATR